LFLASIPQETIFRHRELLESKARNIKNVDCNEEIKEFDLENDIPTTTNKTDCDKISKAEAQEENEGINELCSSRDINRGLKPARKRLISTSLTKTPVMDHELIDYNNHKLTENSDPFDLKYKLYAVIVSMAVKLKKYWN
jgi:ubiquitin carboxyl-terminal hydrolase 6/32